MRVTCSSCKHMWNYTGSSKQYVTCPTCYNKYNISKYFKIENGNLKSKERLKNINTDVLDNNKVKSERLCKLIRLGLEEKQDIKLIITAMVDVMGNLTDEPLSTIEKNSLIDAYLISVLFGKVVELESKINSLLQIEQPNCIFPVEDSPSMIDLIQKEVVKRYPKITNFSDGVKV